MPDKIDVNVSRSMKASPEAVWAVLADLNRLPEWLQFAKAVENVSGPAEVGAKYSVKPPRAYEPTTHWTVSESQAPTHQLHTSEMPVVSGVRSQLQLTPDGQGTTVQVRWSGTPKGIMGKMMSGMMQKRITETWEQSLQALERVVSSGAA
jgi:carbon monoxide dehydrogenase subunit G